MHTREPYLVLDYIVYEVDAPSENYSFSTIGKAEKFWASRPAPEDWILAEWCVDIHGNEYERKL